jgi:hypothetical protein
LVGAGWGAAHQQQIWFSRSVMRGRDGIPANSAGKSAQPDPPTARPSEAPWTAVPGERPALTRLELEGFVAARQSKIGDFGVASAWCAKPNLIGTDRYRMRYKCR